MCEEACIPGNADLSLKLKSGKQSKPSTNAQLIQKFVDLIPHKISATEQNKLAQTAPLKTKKEGAEFTIAVRLHDAEIDTTKEVITAENPGEHLAIAGTPQVTSDTQTLNIIYKGTLKIIPADGNAAFKTLVQYTTKNGKQKSVWFNTAALGESELPAFKTAATKKPSPPPITASEFLGFLYFAFLGGLILNIMPCVLPVISLKVFSFVKQAQESRGRLAFLGIMYCFGVLVSFWVMAGVMIGIKASGGDISWGGLFQFPTFVIAITTVIFAFGLLNLLGVFEIQAPSGKAMQGLSKLQDREGVGGAFFTGVLATILATPCTAPFLGTAVSFALAQPAIIILAIFTGIGFGLAFPFLILAFFPAWTRFIPKPGNWMIRFKQIMGFLLLATAIFLMSIVASQLETWGTIWVLCFLLAVSVSCWLIGSWIDYSTSGTKRITVYAVALLIAAGSYGYFVHNLAFNPPVDNWLPYSAVELDEYRSQSKTVYLDLTASWCLTCKRNKISILKSDEIKQQFKKRETILMVGDYSKFDPEIKKVLDEFNRAGVPTNIIYPPHNGTPILLPELLSKEIVIDGLNKAAEKNLAELK